MNVKNYLIQFTISLSILCFIPTTAFSYTVEEDGENTTVQLATVNFRGRIASDLPIPSGPLEEAPAQVPHTHCQFFPDTNIYEIILSSNKNQTEDIVHIDIHNLKFTFSMKQNKIHLGNLPVEFNYVFDLDHKIVTSSPLLINGLFSVDSHTQDGIGIENNTVIRAKGIHLTALDSSILNSAPNGLIDSSALMSEDKPIIIKAKEFNQYIGRIKAPSLDIKTEGPIIFGSIRINLSTIPIMLPSFEPPSDAKFTTGGNIVFFHPSTMNTYKAESLTSCEVDTVLSMESFTGNISIMGATLDSKEDIKLICKKTLLNCGSKIYSNKTIDLSCNIFKNTYFAYNADTPVQTVNHANGQKELFTITGTLTMGERPTIESGETITFLADELAQNIGGEIKAPNIVEYNSMIIDLPFESSIVATVRKEREGMEALTHSQPTFTTLEGKTIRDSTKEE